MQRTSSSSADLEVAGADCAPGQRQIGPGGRLARLVVGLTFIGLALFWRDPDWKDFVLGLMVAPLFVIGLFAFRARRVGRPLRATGPLGHFANLIILIPLFALPATSGAALLFYGASMLFAAARAAGSCEVTAISNAVLGRDDQVGCPLFWPVDAAEAKFSDSSERRVAEGR
jgi:hypothetical protein